jgi:hypothetical protein
MVSSFDFDYTDNGNLVSFSSTSVYLLAVYQYPYLHNFPGIVTAAITVNFS